MTVIAAARLLLPTGLGPGYLVFENGTITAAAAGPPPTRPDIELSSGTLAPGYVDLQVNGAFGVDLVDATPDEWAAVSEALPATGCTAFVPTFTTAGHATLVRALGAHAAVAGDLPGARSIGVHLEGPYLAEARRGAHPIEHLRLPDLEELRSLIEAAAGQLAYVTLAPELPGATAAIEVLRSAGIRVAIGHSDACFEEVVTAADAGASLVTHLFNAQRSWHQREPGVVGAALTDQRLTCGLIADGHHVHPAGIRLAFAAAPGRIALVTDATAAAGMPAGAYDLGGERLHVAADGPPRRGDGTLAGSSLTMDAAVANAVGSGIDLGTALVAATTTPADVLGATDLGRLTPGARADLVWLDDDLAPRATWIAGQLTYGGTNR